MNKAEALSAGKKFLARTAVPAVGALRANRNRKIDKHIPRELWSVPGFKLAGGPAFFSLKYLFYRLKTVR